MVQETGPAPVGQYTQYARRCGKTGAIGANGQAGSLTRPARQLGHALHRAPLLGGLPHQAATLQRRTGGMRRDDVDEAAPNWPPEPALSGMPVRISQWPSRRVAGLLLRLTRPNREAPDSRHCTSWRVARRRQHYRPRSDSPGWSSGRRPSGQRNFRSDSWIGRSLMHAKRRAIRPSSANSQFSLPYERNQLPESSCHS